MYRDTAELSELLITQLATATRTRTTRMTQLLLERQILAKAHLPTDEWVLRLLLRHPATEARIQRRQRAVVLFAQHCATAAPRAVAAAAAAAAAAARESRDHECRRHAVSLG